MADEWRITEHVPNVAAQFADRWATAVAAQARRIKSPQDTLERVPDTFLQVLVLRQLVRAAEMAAGQADPESRRRIHDALAEFFDAIVAETNATDQAEAFRTARNVLEHFDEYFQGTGNLQRRAKRDDPDLSQEDLAQRYRVELEGPADSPQLRIGPLRPADPLVVIDLVELAPAAARRLCLALGHGHAGWAPI